MALFQQSVIKKHIESLDSKLVEHKWQIFTSIFHNTVKQNNIRNSKEEQFQEGFLRELFVNVLGYTINPDENFNLLTELKNINNSKKADGAIIVDGKAIAVIELKGTETTDLGKIETQAFGYKNNQSGCNYVITSNFEKLRFYIDNTTQLEEFNLFTLNKERFHLLYTCLSWDSIRQNTPIQILNESVSKENIITKKLYNDYSEFKRALFSNLVELNPQFDKLLLFKKSQKLLDRFLFIFFAEDRLLLPTNLIFRINAEWDNLVSARVPVSLYDRYKMYFNDLNQGAKVTLPAFGKKTGEAISAEFEIFAYNGGLFQPDEVLDTIKIDDTLLYNYTQKMSDYNFESDVDVNILGHIFENSLNEIDEVKSEIEGTVLEKTKTRRKKDGVFYTPKYITKYIVDNTIGKLCLEKKEEIKLRDEDYITDKKLQSKTKKGLLDKLAEYRNWLLDITICDPACGSGAFLNQALEFLIAEHRYIDELQAKLMGDAMILSDIENSILERNIFGVDLNDESVEIAKLSLWLRTAQKGRKLNSLTNNIKCGNSLTDDVEIAGEKAFSWEKEFPDVFAKGGFDVIIGNPPYVQLQSMKEFSIKIKDLNYQTFESTGDLYCLFYEKGNIILKNNGLLGYITSNKWMRANYGKTLRKYILNNTKPYLLIDLGAGIFESAIVDSNILFFEKTKNKSNKIITCLNLIDEKIIHDFNSYENKKVEITPINDESWIIKNKSQNNFDQKTSKIAKPLKEWDVKINYGIKTGYNDAFIIDNDTKEQLIKEDPNSIEILEPILRGRDIQKYYPKYENLWLINSHNGNKNKSSIDINKYPAVKNHLDKYWNQINKRYDKGVTPYNLRNCAYIEDFYSEKIMYPNMTAFLPFILDNKGYFTNDKGYIITSKNVNLKFLLVYLNSKFSATWIRSNCPELQGGTRELRKAFFENIPIPNISKSEQEKFSLFADKMNHLHQEFSISTIKFSNYFSKQYQINKLSGKLEKWYDLEFSDFIKELNKTIKSIKGISLTKKDEFEWIDLFEENKQKALSLKTDIDKTDKEIDQMVYSLYELTDEEIKIINSSI